MKSIILSIAVFFAATTIYAQVQTSAVAVASTTVVTKSLPIGAGIPLAGNELKTVNGEVITLKKAMSDGGLLVMFSCNTCPYVIKSQQRTIEVMKQAKGFGVGMVVLNSNEAQRGEADSYEAMVEYAKKQNYTMPYAVDDQSIMANAFGATRTPEVYLFNRKGLLVYKGAMEDNPSEPGSSKEMYLAAAMKNMKAGSKISPAETKSIGCSIKRIN